MALRRFYIRFWPASSAQLTKLLRAAGAPEEALKLVNPVVDTSVAPTRFATEMNQTLQWDILFHKDKMISHIIDEATRFCSVSIVPGRSAASIIRAIHRH